MSTALISITSILLILIAPAYCGTLFAQSFNPNTFWRIIPDPFSYEEVTTDIGAASTEIVYDCVNAKMYNAIDAPPGRNNPYYLVEVDPDTGVPIENLDPDTEVTERLEALEFVNGILYGWSSTVNGLVTVDLTTTPSTITPISSGVAIDPLGGMAYDVCTDTMYGVTSLSARDIESNLVTINLQTGDPSYITNGNTGVDYFGGLAFDDDCLLWGVTAGDDSGQILNIPLDSIGMPVPGGTIGSVRIIGLVNVQESGCQSKSPTAFPTTAPTISTASPTQATATPTTSPTTDSGSSSSDGDSDDADI